MPRPTRLKLLSTRAVPGDMAGQEDDRSVGEAFPARQAEASPDSQLGADILEILNKSHARMTGEVQQATSIASAAVEASNAALSSVTALSDRAKAIEAKTEETGNAIVTLAGMTEKAVARQAIAAASVGILNRLGERFAALGTFLADRAPAFIGLGSAVWLWGKVLADPQPLQLVALGLFGALVIGPAIWLSSRKG